MVGSQGDAGRMKIKRVIKCACTSDGHAFDCANRRLRKLAQRVARREQRWKVKKNAAP